MAMVKRQKHSDTKEKEEKITMAVMTAQCDRAFVVDPKKAEEFMAQQKNREIDKQMKTLASKVCKSINKDEETGN